MSWDPDTVQAALNFAEAQHRGQKVPSSEAPYLRHIIGVATEVMHAVAVSTVEHPTLAVVCALLHDVVEDTPCTLRDIAAAFGDEVAKGVSALTKDASLPKTDRMADSLARIGACRPEVAMVKMADRISNLQPPPEHWDADKIAAYREEAKAILSALGSANATLSSRLKEKIERYPPTNL